MIRTATVIIVGVVIAGVFGLISIPASLVAGFTAVIGIFSTATIANS